MKRFLSLLAVGALSIGLANSASAQSRDIGAQRLILDDGGAGRLTISYAGPGISTFTIPAGGGTVVPNGTTLNSTLSWNGTAWVENANLLAPVAGGLNLTGAPLAASSALLNLSAGAGGIDGTYYGVNSAITTGTGGIFDLVGVRGSASGTDDLAVGGDFSATGLTTNIGGRFSASGGGTNIGVQVTSGGIDNTGGLNNNDGGITNTGAISGASTIDATTVNTINGYRIGGTATAGEYLRGDGTNFVSSAIQAADLPAGSTNYINNSLVQQSPANFNIDGAGTVGTTMSVGAGADIMTIGEGTVTRASGSINFDAGTGSTHFLGVNGLTRTSFSTSDGVTATFRVGFPSASAAAIGANDGQNLIIAGFENSNLYATEYARFGPTGNLTTTRSATLGDGDDAINLNAGTGTFTLNSSTLDVNAGAITGATGITSSGAITFSGLSTAGVVHNSAAGLLSTSLIVNADVDPAAAIVDTKLATISTAGKVANSATTATATNTASTIVLRDGSGNFTAGTITAALTGNVTGNVSGTAANVTGIVAVANGGTGTASAAANTVFAGPNGAPGAPSFRALVAADIPGGSGSYINNSGVQQVGAQFNIDGAGVAQSLSSNTTVNATTQYNVNGVHALSLIYTGNTRVGQAASAGVTAGGSYNTSVGFQAGRLLTTGDENTFLGTQAGDNVTTGNQNTIVGKDAGYSSSGSGNSILGIAAGYNSSGSNNTFIGNSAGFANTTGANNTYLGTGSTGPVAATNATALGNGATATASNQVVLGNGSVTQVTTAGTVNAGTGFTVAGAAAATTSFLKGDGTSYKAGTILDADIPAAIARDAEIPTTAVGGDLTGTVANAQIAGGAIINADVNAAAAIDYSKLAALPTGSILAGNAGVPTALAMSGDATISNTGAVTVSSFNGGTAFGDMAGQSSNNVNITGGSITGVTFSSTTLAATSATNQINLGSVGGGAPFGTTINSVAPASADLIYTIPDAGANASFVMTEGNQTINGTKTFGSPIAGSVTGSAASFTGALVGDVTGTQGATVVSTVGGMTAANVALGATAANNATSANVASRIVMRDGTGNFAATLITGDLAGNVNGASVRGDNVIVGSLVNKSTFSTLAVGARTLTLPDASGTVALTSDLTALGTTYLKLDGTSTMAGALAMGGNDITSINNLTANNGGTATFNGHVVIGNGTTDHIDIGGVIRGTLKFDDAMDGNRFVIAVPDPVAGTQTYTVPDIVANGTFALTTGSGATVFSGPTALRTYTLPDANATIATDATALMLSNTSSKTVDMNNAAATTLTIQNSGAGVANIAVDGGIDATTGTIDELKVDAATNRFAGIGTTSAGDDVEIVANSLVTTSSIIVAVLNDDDLGSFIQRVTPQAGQFEVKFSAAMTDGIKFSYIIVNP